MEAVTVFILRNKSFIQRNLL